MSSVLRSFGNSTSSLPTGQFIPAYFTNTAGYSQPFPWRYDKKTQAIDLEFVDGFTNSTGLSDDEMFFRGQNFSGLRLVQKLGPGFIEWCEGSLSADAGSVRLHEKPIVVIANMIAAGQNPNNGESQEQSYSFGFEDATGTAEGKYCKTLIFMKPMVIKYTISGTEYYRWFYQNFEGNS